MLDEIGLFEERYFAYYEDVELAWRARRAGWRCLYAPQAQVLHVHSATGRIGSAFKAYHVNRNRVWTFIRHYPAHRFLIWWPLVLLLDVATWFWPLLAGRTSALRGHVDALKEWSWAWGERHRLSDWRHPVPLVFPRLRMLGIPK
jgi:GT2 family glycosyltransferase